MEKYKRKLAGLLMFVLCIGMIPFPGRGKETTVRAEEITKTEKQVTLDEGVLQIEGIAVVTSEALAGVDLQEIQRIEFGTNVRKIADGAFENCHNLTEITWVVLR